ncbi:DUF3962 domain-containing protein [Streptomyces sp. NBC_01363]|uniref:pPIWI_RE module domain-containing protein n=1 Tax=Streptomyces sp. NBC_01363 TaxID=2903840 RepID=UPI00224DFD1D|nr:DUF3962 domain-containing protein [Streptomyces sp. NBC_01363]MCX4735342.1 DUF3962 domain-containing protein [Streptomyces sp. NBC_01363]
MPPVYRSARTTAWRPADALASHTAPYRVLPFPEQWRDAVLTLCNAPRVAAGKEPWKTAPTWRLEQVLQAFAPDVLALPRPFHDRDPGAPAHWLCAPADLPDPLPGPVLGTVLKHWLRDLRPEPEYRGLLKETIAELAAHPPRWETVHHELMPRDAPTDGGTARPSPHQYSLSPDWLARRILALGPYLYDGGQLTFRAMPRGPRDQGAQLVSEPIRFPGPDEKQDSWWSVTLSITLQTVPFDPLPRFNLRWSVRRWATRTSAKTGRLRLPWGASTTVLLRPRRPFLPGTPRSERFAVAALERYWDKDLGEKGEFADRWRAGGPAAMLAGLPLGEPFPDADAILTDPASWLRDDARAGILYRTAMGRHDVGPGFMAHQLSQLTAWAEGALTSELRRAPDLSLIDRGTPANIPKGDKETVEAERCAQRRLATAYALDALDGVARQGGAPVLEARLLWQSPRLRDAALASLAEHLGLKGDGGSFTAQQYDDATAGASVVHEWSAPELTVRVHCLRPLVALGDRTADSLLAPLDLPTGTHIKDAQVTAATVARRDSAAQWLAAERTTEAPALALVEIGRAASYPSRLHDPKFAMRLGFAKAGFVTQFTTVPVAGDENGKGAETASSLRHRTLSAWNDGLRQLGARTLPRLAEDDGLPDGLRHAALWMVRKNRTTRNRWAAYLPVGVMVTPDQAGTGAARVEGWDPEARSGAGAWVPYPELLLRLTTKAEVKPVLPSQRGSQDDEADTSEVQTESGTERPKRYKERERQRREAAEWLQGLRASLRTAPTVLFAEAHNARSHWTWLQDGRIERDRLQDGLAPARRLDPDLRMVRVRAGARNETPQWWGRAPEGKANGIQQGLWVPEDAAEDGRVFFSTTAKPVQFKHAAVTADKLSPRPIAQGKRKGEPTIDTGQAAWMPGLLEIAVVGCHRDDGDDPRSLALLTHVLRQPSDYDQALALPLPLHLAGLAQEYVLPTPKDDEAETGDAGAAGQSGASDDLDDAQDASPVEQPVPNLELEAPDVDAEGQLQLFEM